MTIDIRRFALALGLTAAIAVFILGLSAWLLSWGEEWVQLVGGVYRGYAPTLFGSIIGALWAFVDGFIGGALFGWLYNKLQ